MTQSVDTASDLSLPSPKERRRLRESGDLTPEELAAALGVTPTTVRSWETGRTEPRGRKREAYAKLLARLGSLAEEPTDTEPAPPGAEAARPEPGHPEPGHPEPGHPEPGHPEPGHPGPGHPEPGQPEPTHPEAAHAAPARLEYEPPEPTPPEPTRPGRTQSERDQPEPAQPEPPLPGPPAGRGRPLPPAKPASPSTRPKPAAKRAAKPPMPVARHNPPRRDQLAAAFAAARERSSVGTSAPAETSRQAAPEPPSTAPATSPAPSPAPAAADQEGIEAGTAEGIEEHQAALAEPPLTPDPDADPDLDPTSTSTSTPPPTPPPLSPEQTFDALYAYCSGALIRQAYLLTGRRALAQEAVERAFQQAWERWPEVATDPDPVGWVRAVAYEYALSPWHQFRRAHKHPDQPPASPADRALMDAMLELTPVHRRTVLLYDGVGLDLPETAAETEASTPAAGRRLLNAHARLTARMPELSVPGVLHHRLGSVVPSVRLEPRPAAVVRAAGEHRTRRWTRAAIGLTAVIAAATAYTTATAPREYVPKEAPGTAVSGVPPHSGPQQLTEQDVELREKLRSEPAPGPERLVPSST
ncbi:helix-turn-helix domain-containing protein [Streptomyces sp. NPDC101118]|uniref:helix-turn-helix domain-containing protein n=1 Tax=Streptomyces sp. NPDC101118 TaxID=3366109 RepID=UPI00381208AA